MASISAAYSVMFLVAGETVILLHRPLPSVGVSTETMGERQQNDRTLADGCIVPLCSTPVEFHAIKPKAVEKLDVALVVDIEGLALAARAPVLVPAWPSARLSFCCTPLLL